MERFHGTLNQILRVYMERDDKSWQQYINIAAFAYNTKINKASQLTPFEAFIGRPKKLPIDLILPTPERRYKNEAAYVKDTMLQFEQMYELARDNT